MNVRWRYLALAALGVLILARLLTISWSDFLSLDVSAGFLGESQESPVDSIREQLILDQSRLVFYSVDGDDPSEKMAQLAEQPGIRAVGMGIGDTSKIEEILFSNRLVLFFPHWLKVHSASLESPNEPEDLGAQAAADFDAFLQSPESLGMEDYALKDPLLLLPSVMESASSTLSSSATPSIWWAELEGNTFRPDVQESMLPLLSESAAGNPWIGAIRFAEASRTEIKSEVTRLNLISLLAVGAIVIIFLRRPISLAHVAVPVLFAMSGSVAVFSLLEGELHIVSLVFASVLTGISVDYGIHLLLHATEGNQRILVRSLLLAGVSSVIGFAMIIFTDNPVIRDTGLIVTLGLSIALICAFLYPPFFRKHPGVRFQRIFHQPLRLPRLSTKIAFSLLTLVALGGLLSVSWKDEVGIMNIPLPELEAEASTLLSNSATAPSATVAVGSSYLQAISRLQEAAPGGLAEALPTESTLDAVEKFAPRGQAFIQAFQTELENRGIDSTLLAPFFQELKAYFDQVSDGREEQRANAVLATIASQLRGPLQIILGSHGEEYWAGSMQPRQTPTPFTFSTSQSNSFSEKMAGFRRDLTQALLIGITAIAAGLLIFLGWRDGLATLLPLLACGAITLGGVAWFHSLNLFHLTGVLLGSCIGLDYLVFYRLFRRSGGHFPISIRFSLFTTAAGFTVLLFSHITAVQSVGITVLSLMVLVHLWIESDRSPSRS